MNIVVCAWCTKYLGMTGEEGDQGISHGPCDGCKAELPAVNPKNGKPDYAWATQQINARLAKLGL